MRSAILDSAGNAVVEYSYDAWGKLLATTGSMAPMLGLHNPLRYRGYVYDNETALYYLQSRYYDPEIGRFINADDTGYLGADGSLLSLNLFAYCKNNPIIGRDPAGHFAVIGATIAIIATGAIVGCLLGAASAAATGGNALEGAIEGFFTGALGSACGILIPSTALAVTLAAAGGAAIDFTTQAATQYIKDKSFDLSKIDGWRVGKTALEVGLGTLVPKYGQGAKDAVDAFGTALIWAETSALIVCADIAITNIVATSQNSPSGASRNRRGVAMQGQEMLLK